MGGALLLALSTMQVGTIQGMILEYQSGWPLSRARVHLAAADAGGARGLTPQISGRSGPFSFGAVPEGWYLVTAERDTYAVASFGERRPEGFGRAFRVRRDSAEFIERRLHKPGVITGPVRDENGAGVGGIRVTACARRLPLRQAGSAATDGRAASVKLSGGAAKPMPLRLYESP